jgi:ATP-dependent exoDNAse (exonuclease V) alpha subunit
MMQQKESTKPVRIKAGLMQRLEQYAIEEGSRTKKLTTIAEIVDQLLNAKLNEISPQDAKSGKSKQ